MKILSDFKEFAMRGNVVDLAVGIIIGAAFGKIVSSLVADMIMPPIGLLLGGTDFPNLSIVLKKATEAAPAVVIGYGKFIQALLDFVVIAFAVFALIKGLNSLKKKQAETPSAAPAPTKEELLLGEIRDILKKDSAK